MIFICLTIITNLLATAQATSTFLINGNPHDIRYLENEFEKFINFFDKIYSGPAEKSQRFEIWKNNVYLIDKHNLEADLGKHTFWLKMNRFGDLVNILKLKYSKKYKCGRQNILKKYFLKHNFTIIKF